MRSGPPPPPHWLDPFLYKPTTRISSCLSLPSSWFRHRYLCMVYLNRLHVSDPRLLVSDRNSESYFALRKWLNLFVLENSELCWEQKWRLCCGSLDWGSSALNVFRTRCKETLEIFLWMFHVWFCRRETFAASQLGFTRALQSYGKKPCSQHGSISHLLLHRFGPDWTSLYSIRLPWNVVGDHQIFGFWPNTCRTDSPSKTFLKRHR